MTDHKWIIYGANGYTGELIARESARLGLNPVLAGRNETRVRELADELGLDALIFSLHDPEEVRSALDEAYLVLHCAGPFSETSAPMIRGCLDTGTHYLDITGEIDVFTRAHGYYGEARDRDVILCPGVGFDVVPTDCVAAALREALPDAVHLALGFDSKGSFSPGTAKTSIEGLAQGGRIRSNGVIKKVRLGYKTRRIDFGDGEKLAMTIPWGDVATAYFTTQIPDIEVYMPTSPTLLSRVRKLNWLRPLLRMGPIQRGIKKKIQATVKGPNLEQRDAAPTYVWGEVGNAAGDKRVARLETANGYSLTVTAAVAIVRRLLDGRHAGGYFTPSQLMGSDFVCTLPGSSQIEIE